jgi:hypothetical protein
VAVRFDAATVAAARNARAAPLKVFRGDTSFRASDTRLGERES